MSDIKKIKNEFLNKLNANLDIESVNKIKSELFGKNGKISSFFKNLGSLPAEERKKFASDLNFAKDELQEKINKKRDFKSLWIQRINAGVRAEGLTYSKSVSYTHLTLPTICSV